MWININNAEQLSKKLYNYLCKHKLYLVKVGDYMNNSFTIRQGDRTVFVEYSKIAGCIYINNSPKIDISALSAINLFCQPIYPYSLNGTIKYFNLLLKCNLI